MDALLRQDWIQLAAVAIGVIITVVVFGPMFVARASAKISAQQYAARTPLATLVVGLMAGAIAVPYFTSAEALFFVVFALVFLAILLGWVLMFQTDAVRFAGLFSLFGPFQPIPERMAVPVRHSWPLSALFLIGGLIAGASIRVLLLAA